MREDPIIYEDWEIGHDPSISVKRLQLIDFSISVVLVLVFLIWSISIENAFRLFLWLFTIVLLLFVEVIIDQTLRTIYDRLLVIIGLFIEIFISLNNAPELSIIMSVIVTMLLVGKLVLIPISVSSHSFAGEILVPKNENVELVLKEHIARLDNTEFRLLSETEYHLSISKLNRSIILLFLPGLFTSVLLLFLFEVGAQPLGDFIILMLISITGLSFTGIVAIWYLLNRFERKQEIAEEEKFPTFA